MNKKKDLKKILILYTEVAGYTIACVNELIKHGIKVYLIKWDVNNEAPFQINDQDIIVKSRNEFNNKSLINYSISISPDLLLVCGWIDKGYLKAARYWMNKIPTVLTMDNSWCGNIRQIFSTLISPYFILNKFSHIWVPGKKQKFFAQKLGFEENKIITGFYSCDTDLYVKYYNESINQKENQYPRVFLYVGRYIKTKGIYNLWKAFIEFNSKYNNNWELWCVGTGEEWDNRIKHEKIKHLGFIQPEDFSRIIAKSGVYILPSEFEPWGVSLHEFVTAGFPVIVTEQVGSSEIFVRNYVNGIIIKSKSKEEIIEAMVKFMKMSQKELLLMSQESVSLSKLITPKKWVNNLLSIK